MCSKMADVANPELLRNIKIKTGVVKRLAKEMVYYAKEETQNQERVNKMKADGKDEYDIRKMEEVTAESRMMIPDCERKLGTAWSDLHKLVQEGESDMKNTEEHKAAVAMLEETKSAAKK